MNFNAKGTVIQSNDVKLRSTIVSLDGVGRRYFLKVTCELEGHSLRDIE